jgi:hypothetical protein
LLLKFPSLEGGLLELLEPLDMNEVLEELEVLELCWRPWRRYIPRIMILTIDMFR